MVSTSISEITEIYNKSTSRFFIYVWDNAHEGRYSPYRSDDWHYPADGTWLAIEPGAHLRADDCGIPDGGKSSDRDRVRVLFKAEPGQKAGKGDPGRGLRINRLAGGDGHDRLVFASHATGETLIEIPLPTVMHQTLLLTFNDGDGGIRFTQKDITKSGEAIAVEELKKVQQAMLDLLDIAKNAMEIAAEAM